MRWTRRAGGGGASSRFPAGPPRPAPREPAPPSPPAPRRRGSRTRATCSACRSRGLARSRGRARRRLDGPEAPRRERRWRVRARPAVGRVVEQLALRAEQRVPERHADRSRGLVFHRVRVGGAVHAHGAFLLETEPRVPADDAFGSRQALVHLVQLVRIHRIEGVVVLHVRVLEHVRQALANRHRARVRVARQHCGRAPHLVAAGATAVEHGARHFPPDNTDTARRSTLPERQEDETRPRPGGDGPSAPTSARGTCAERPPASNSSEPSTALRSRPRGPDCQCARGRWRIKTG